MTERKNKLGLIYMQNQKVFMNWWKIAFFSILVFLIEGACASCVFWILTQKLHLEVFLIIGIFGSILTLFFAVWIEKKALLSNQKDYSDNNSGIQRC